jgi:hypothetical protein
MFEPMNTSDHTTSYRKTLLYGHHGWGKTTQFIHYQKQFGEGFILSGESGLSSIRDAGIDYLPFTSWASPSDASKNTYSFVDIFKWMMTDDFKSKGYKWVGVDSLTELSDMSMRHANQVAEDDAKKSGKAVNGFQIFSDHAKNLIGACKAIRDMNMHVLVTALAKEGQDDAGNTEYWPMVAGKQSQQQLPGIFDNVFCGVRHTTDTHSAGEGKVIRYVVTEEYNGWKGKVRDERRRLKPVEQTGNIVSLFVKMDMDDDEYNARIKQGSEQ